MVARMKEHSTTRYAVQVTLRSHRGGKVASPKPPWMLCQTAQDEPVKPLKPLKPPLRSVIKSPQSYLTPDGPYSSNRCEHLSRFLLHPTCPPVRRSITLGSNRIGAFFPFPLSSTKCHNVTAHWKVSTFVAYEMPTSLRLHAVSGRNSDGSPLEG